MLHNTTLHGIPDRDSSKCPSVALMFQIGEAATYRNVSYSIQLLFQVHLTLMLFVSYLSFVVVTSKTCRGHEVDIMHFSIGNAIPGRLYGSNPIDGRNGNGVTSRFGLQDVQFTIDGSSKMSVAFWYPVDANPWVGSGHYTINCDWIPLDIASGGSMLTESAPNSDRGTTRAFALLFSIAAVGTVILEFIEFQLAPHVGDCTISRLVQLSVTNLFLLNDPCGVSTPDLC
ncbi:hypothetical protein GQ457_05G001610 [Hibiscus cannabinus]